MNAMTALSRLKDQLALYWLARTEKERKYLTVGGATVIGALIYMLFIDPALTGRARLRAELPQLRQQAAQLSALAQEATDLARQGTPQVAPMSRESLTASLTQRSLKPQSMTVTGEYVKIELTGVAFANLFAWIDAQRRENRISVEEAAITAATPAGQVDAAITLRQKTAAGG